MTMLAVCTVQQFRSLGAPLFCRTYIHTAFVDYLFVERRRDVVSEITAACGVPTTRHLRVGARPIVRLATMYDDIIEDGICKARMSSSLPSPTARSAL
jgi:hypothetical protein